VLSKNKIKLINSLKNKKGRQESGLFVVEGEKMVDELINSNFKVDCIIAIPEWISQNSNIIKEIQSFETDEPTLKKISSLTTPNKVLALAKIKESKINFEELESDLSLVLDTIQDPGNLGTIIRTADWFGIKNIICSHNSVDVYNSKVIQSTMGAVFRTNVYYEDLENLFQKINSSIDVYGTFLEGENIYSNDLNKNGLIVFGNESKGISRSIEKYITKKITIPSFSSLNGSMESLNITAAAAIVCSEFRRRVI
jgi:TrmH family RNA methyltransferase